MSEARIEWHQDALDELLASPEGDVGKWFAAAGDRVAERARSGVEVATGQLGDSLATEVRQGDDGQLEVRIGPSADRNTRTEGNRTNAEVARFVEFDKPFLRPALDEVAHA